MPQGHEQLASVLAVLSSKRRSDVVTQHLPDLCRSMLLAQQVLTERRCSALRNVLVLGYRENLSLGEAAHRDAVLKRNHGKDFISSCPTL